MPIAELPALLGHIAGLSQTAIQQAAVICVDDVAVNTKLLTGLERGHKGHSILKVVGGSLLNKIVLMPLAIVISTVAPGAVLPLLALGGLNLAVEGVEKLRGKGHDHESEQLQANIKDPEALEKKKIKSALKVDFILSAEVTILTLSLVVGAPLITQLAVLAATGIAVTAGLYGLIGGIIKLDDAGRWFSGRKGNSPVALAARKFGTGVEKFVPHLMKGISAVGTVALLVIGGELLLQGIPGAEQALTGALGGLANGPAAGLISLAAEAGVGLAAGLAAIPVAAVLRPVLSRVVSLGKKATAGKEKPSLHKFTKALQASPEALRHMPDLKSALNSVTDKAVSGAQKTKTCLHLPRMRGPS